MRFAERVVFMEKGQVRFSGQGAELANREDLLRSVFLGARRPDRRSASPTRAVAVGAGAVVVVAALVAGAGSIGSNDPATTPTTERSTTATTVDPAVVAWDQQARTAFGPVAGVPGDDRHQHREVVAW